MSAAAAQAPIEGVMCVRPGDMAAATEVDGWLCEYASSRDRVLQERIILAIWVWLTGWPSATALAARR